MEDLVSTEFLGFSPDQLYKEIYAVGYNEFIDAVKVLKTTLLEEFPDKEEEIVKGCDSLLLECEQKFDKEWFEKFIQYCSKNIFQIPRHVPVYDPQLGESEANQEALIRVKELKHQIMATEYLNAKLIQTIQEVDREIEARQKLMERIKETKVKLAVVKRGRELEAELKSITDGTNTSPSEDSDTA